MTQAHEIAVKTSVSHGLSMSSEVFWLNVSAVNGTATDKGIRRKAYMKSIAAEA